MVGTAAPKKIMTSGGMPFLGAFPRTIPTNVQLKPTRTNPEIAQNIS
jgi:hypothetical protein